MTKLSHVILILMLCMVSTTAYAASWDYRFTHNDQDTLIIGEVISKDHDSITIASIYYVVSSSGMAPDREYLRPQTANVVNIEYYYDTFDLGDYIIASLNKDEDCFKVAQGMFKLDSSNYKTLNVYSDSSGDSAYFKDFLNNGIEYNEQNRDEIAELMDSDVFDIARAIIYPAVEENQDKAQDSPGISIGIIGIAVFLICGTTIFFIRRIARNRRV